MSGEVDAPGADQEPVRPLHPRSFKLRFAAAREQGRSYVSPIKPLALPAPVADVIARPTVAPADREAEAKALVRVELAYAQGPRDKYPTPVTTSHEYGWWPWQRAEAFGDRRLNQHIRESWWLKERARLLAPDATLRRR